MQSSMVVLETVVKGHSLIITDTQTMVETVTYQFRGEFVPKAPEKCTIVC